MFANLFLDKERLQNTHLFKTNMDYIPNNRPAGNIEDQLVRLETFKGMYSHKEFPNHCAVTPNVNLKNVLIFLQRLNTRPV